MALPFLTFLLDKNLELPVTEKPWHEILSAAGINTEATTDFVHSIICSPRTVLTSLAFPGQISASCW